MIQIKIQDSKFRYPVLSRERIILDKATQEDYEVAKYLSGIINRFGLNAGVIGGLIELLDQELNNSDKN